MTELQVRRGRPDDLQRLAAIDEQAGAGSPRRIRIDRFLSGDAGWCLVAETGGKAVGYVAVAPGQFLGRDFVELLVVAAAHRRTGIGSRLLGAAVAEAAGPDGDAVFTSTNASNEPMLSLLRGAGWHLSGTLEGIDEGDPEVVFFRL